MVKGLIMTQQLKLCTKVNGKMARKMDLVFWNFQKSNTTKEHL